MCAAHGASLGALIIDWMPYIVRMDFDGERFLRLEELAHIEKPYRP